VFHEKKCRHFSDVLSTMWGWALYCTVLYCTVLFCTVLHCASRYITHAQNSETNPIMGKVDHTIGKYHFLLCTDTSLIQKYSYISLG
jgi:hypothetical protein